MRIFWTILGIAGGLVLLLLIGVAIAVWTVDVNQFVAPVQKKVKEATGRDLTIGGGVRLSLGLEPKLVLNDVHFGNASWAKDKDLASVKQVEADVALLPLLQRRFEVVRLNLVDPVITLETGAGGKVNWEFGTGAPAGPPIAAAGAGAASTLANFGIANVVIENGTLTVRDAACGDGDARHHRPLRCAGAQFRLADQRRVPRKGRRRSDLALRQPRLRSTRSCSGANRTRSPSRARSPAARRISGPKFAFIDGTTHLEDLAVGFGSSKATGEATVATGARKKVTLRLSSPSIALADLKLPPRAAPGAAAVAKGTAWHRHQHQHRARRDGSSPTSPCRSSDSRGPTSTATSRSASSSSTTSRSSLTSMCASR